MSVWADQFNPFIEANLRLVHSTIRLTTEFRKHQEMGRLLSFTDAVAECPAQAVVAPSGALSANDIILVMKVGIVFINIITVAFSTWRSFSSASPNPENLVSSSAAWTLESADMKTIHQLQASFLPLLVVFDSMVPSKSTIAFEIGSVWINFLPLVLCTREAGLAIEWAKCSVAWYEAPLHSWVVMLGDDQSSSSMLQFVRSSSIKCNKKLAAISLIVGDFYSNAMKLHGVWCTCLG